MSMNRKTATKLLLVQWARFQNECIRLEGSTLLTGVNGSGKSTVLDAMTYLLTGNTQFNKAAKDRDRTVIGYVRGDTKSNGTERYLRTGEVISYIAMEFWSPLDQSFLVVGVCMESDNEIACRSSWFICRDARIDEINFTSTEGKRIRFTPKNELAVRGEKLRSAEFLGKERGVEQVLRALGLRCNASKYRSRLLKMMAFNPENNIDQFIQDCVLEPGRVDSLKELREQRHQFDHIKEMYGNLRSSKAQLETIEQRTGEYERKLRSLRIRELMLLYQDLREKEEEKKQEEIRLEALKTKKERLEIRQKELDKRYKEAGERCRIAENNDIFRGVRESIQALERQIEKLNEEKEKQENGLALLMKLQAQISAILKWADPFIEVEEEDRNCLAHLSEGGRQIEEKLRSYLRFKEQMQGQKQIFWEEEIHCGDRIRELDQELDELETEIKQLKSNQMVFPKNAEAAKRIIYEELKQLGIQSDVRLFAELVQEVKDAEWRAAIETFLGRKRFYIIVDGQYCHKAMEVLERRKLHGVHVVITDKLPETDISAGSAAEMLVIPNVYARRYANYLLNGIHLCGSLEELHEYPRGGLMKNGMLAKSYAVSNMDVDGTEFCLGGDAIRLQLNRKEEAKKQKQEERKSNQKQKEQSRRYRSEIEGVDWEAGHYDFDAAKSLEATLERKERIQ
ncbi:MAG: ATP-binding protein [Enterocloster sp.]